MGYHLYCQNIKLTHLCFANDLVGFTDRKKRSIEGLLQVFPEFAKCSELSIRLEKSTLFMAGFSEEVKVTILNQFPFDSGTLPVRYLGLPLLTKRMRVEDYNSLLEKIKGKIR